MNKIVYNYLKWELDHLEENIRIIKKYAAGELIPLNIRWILKILRIWRVVNAAELKDNQEQLINSIAKELGYIK